MQEHSPQQTRVPFVARIVIAVAGLLLILSTVVFTWKFGPEIEKKLNLLSHNTEVAQRRSNLYRQLKILIDKEEEANDAALADAKTALFRTFNTYSDRVPEFAKEVATIKNRFSIATKSAMDSANKTNEAQQFVAELFGRHVVTPPKMTADLTKIVNKFQSEMEANRAILIRAAAHRIHEADLGDVGIGTSEKNLRIRITRQMQQEKAQMSDTTSKISTSDFSGKHVVEESSNMLSGQIVRIGSSNLILDVIVKAGTAVGLVVGLGIGYFADQWMSTRMQKNIIKQTRKALTTIRDEIWGAQKKGLKFGMERAIQQSRDISMIALDKVVSGEV